MFINDRYKNFPVLNEGELFKNLMGRHAFAETTIFFKGNTEARPVEGYQFYHYMLYFVLLRYPLDTEADIRKQAIEDMKRIVEDDARLSPTASLYMRLFDRAMTRKNFALIMRSFPGALAVVARVMEIEANVTSKKLDTSVNYQKEVAIILTLCVRSDNITDYSKWRPADAPPKFDEYVQLALAGAQKYQVMPVPMVEHLRLLHTELIRLHTTLSASLKLLYDWDKAADTGLDIIGTAGFCNAFTIDLERDLNRHVDTKERLEQQIVADLDAYDKAVKEIGGNKCSPFYGVNPPSYNLLRSPLGSSEERDNARIHMNEAVKSEYAKCARAAKRHIQKHGFGGRKKSFHSYALLRALDKTTYYALAAENALEDVLQIDAEALPLEQKLDTLCKNAVTRRHREGCEELKRQYESLEIVDLDSILLEIGKIAVRVQALTDEVRQWSETKELIVRRAEKLIETFKSISSRPTKDIEQRIKGAIVKLEKLTSADDPTENAIESIEKELLSITTAVDKAIEFDARLDELARRAQDDINFLDTLETTELSPFLEGRRTELLSDAKKKRNAIVRRKSDANAEALDDVLGYIGEFKETVSRKQEQARRKRTKDVETLIEQAQTRTDLREATDLLTQAEELAQGLDPAVLEDVRTARQALNEKREDLAMSCENVKNYVKALLGGSNNHQKRKLGLIEQLDVCTPDTETVLSLEQAAKQLARDIGKWNGEREAFEQDVRNLLDVIENAVNERDEQDVRDEAENLKDDLEDLLDSDNVEISVEWRTALEDFQERVSVSRQRRIRAVRAAIEQAKRERDVQLLADALTAAEWLGPDLLQEVQDAQANIIATRKEKRTELEKQVNAIRDDLKGATNEHDYEGLRIRAQELETQMIDLLQTPEEIEFDHAAARRKLDDLKRDIGKTREKRTNEVNVNLVSVVRAVLASPGYDIAIAFDRLQEDAKGLSDELQQKVQNERKRVEGVRRDNLFTFVDTAIDELSVKPLENATLLVKGLPDRDSLLAEIDAARREIENKLAHQERAKRADEFLRPGNKWMIAADNFFAASTDPNATAFDRYKAAMDAKNAADKGIDFWRQAMRIYHADDPERPIFQLEIDKAERNDFAANVERAYAAYLAQLERERKEALAKRLREGDVPAAAAATERALCVAPPLRTREQLAAASALADFMREMPEWYDVYEKWKLHYRRCVNGHKYLEINNVGSWTCRQHALPPDARDGRHPCCDKSDAGCVRADHRNGTAPFTAAQTICGVPDFILRAMTSTARPGRRGKDAFVRFDEAEHARRSKPAIRVIHTPRARDRKKTVDVLLPDVLTLERSATENRVRMPGGDDGDGDEVWLWDWNQASQPRVARIIYLDQVSYFIYRETKDTVTFKVALLVRDVPVITQSGRRGVPYRNHPQAKLEFTPLERATLWPSSSDY